jgi:site-specific recombinase XerC
LARDLSFIRSHMVPEIGHYKLADLRPMVISEWVNGLLEKGLAPATVAKHLQLLSGVLDSAVRNELIATNSAKLVEPPASQRRRPGSPSRRRRSRWRRRWTRGGA